MLKLMFTHCLSFLCNYFDPTKLFSDLCLHREKYFDWIFLLFNQNIFLSVLKFSDTSSKSFFSYKKINFDDICDLLVSHRLSKSPKKFTRMNF